MLKNSNTSSPRPLPFFSYKEWIGQYFSLPVQKISVDGGFTCPNRDGRLSHEGCTYCNNKSFVPSYCRETDSIKKQIEEGKVFFRRKHPELKFLAYFQSYSNTYAHPTELQCCYEDALSVEDVVGIVISTRPDCLPDEVLDYLAELSQRTFLTLEIGVESTNDDILRTIHRGHDFACSVDAIERAASRGIIVGAHLIVGLPGSSLEQEKEQISRINQLPITLLKLHQLQIIRDTPLAQQYCSTPFPLLSADSYRTFVADYLEHLRPDIVVERMLSQAPPNMVIAPQWNIKNHEFVHQLTNYMTVNGMYQGRLWQL